MSFATPDSDLNEDEMLRFTTIVSAEVEGAGYEDPSVAVDMEILMLDGLLESAGLQNFGTSVNDSTANVKKHGRKAFNKYLEYIQHRRPAIDSLLPEDITEDLLGISFKHPFFKIRYH